ncbi:unnamed protein product [Gongylonema pulchrum]|uniref:Uncharacterized protein n=1 Tax=Gongylonema pulchrum TaxID=637853 RepID=A0A3P6SZZ1_9BILA|nr:unnamed protein product [Gongylonema pulchrum]
MIDSFSIIPPWALLCTSSTVRQNLYQMLCTRKGSVISHQIGTLQHASGVGFRTESNRANAANWAQSRHQPTENF